MALIPQGSALAAQMGIQTLGAPDPVMQTTALPAPTPAPDVPTQPGFPSGGGNYQFPNHMPGEFGGGDVQTRLQTMLAQMRENAMARRQAHLDRRNERRAAEGKDPIGMNRMPHNLGDNPMVQAAAAKAGVNPGVPGALPAFPARRQIDGAPSYTPSAPGSPGGGAVAAPAPIMHTMPAPAAPMPVQPGMPSNGNTGIMPPNLASHPAFGGAPAPRPMSPPMSTMPVTAQPQMPARPAGGATQMTPAMPSATLPNNARLQLPTRNV